MTAVKPEPTLAHRNLPLLLLLAREGVLAQFRPLLHAHGLTEQQWRIVRVLVDVESLEPRQIGRLCGISSPSLAGVLARMQEQGLIERRSLAHDRRRQAVSATPTSRRLARHIAPEIEAVYAELESRLGADCVRQAYAVLDRMIDVLDGGAEAGAP